MTPRGIVASSGTVGSITVSPSFRIVVSDCGCSNPLFIGRRDKHSLPVWRYASVVEENHEEFRGRRMLLATAIFGALSWGLIALLLTLF